MTTSCDPTSLNKNLNFALKSIKDHFVSIGDDNKQIYLTFKIFKTSKYWPKNVHYLWTTQNKLNLKRIP